MSSARRFVWKMLIRVGNSLTVIGCAGLILGLSGVIPVEFFAIGISHATMTLNSLDTL